VRWENGKGDKKKKEIKGKKKRERKGKWEEA
jgi:hypothetical protein